MLYRDICFYGHTCVSAFPTHSAQSDHGSSILYIQARIDDFVHRLSLFVMEWRLYCQTGFYIYILQHITDRWSSEHLHQCSAHMHQWLHLSAMMNHLAHRSWVLYIHMDRWFSAHRSIFLCDWMVLLRMCAWFLWVWLCSCLSVCHTHSPASVCMQVLCRTLLYSTFAKMKMSDPLKGRKANFVSRDCQCHHG